MKILAGAIAPTSGEILLDGSAVSIAASLGRAPARHRDGLPGDQPGALADRGAEPLSRRREVLQPAARHLYRRPSSSSRPELRRRSGGTGRQPRRGAEADGRDRPRGPAEGPDHHLRRADRDPDAGGKAPFLRPDRPAQGPRRRDGVHLATRWKRRWNAATGSPSCATERGSSPTRASDFTRDRIVAAMVGRTAVGRAIRQRRRAPGPAGRREGADGREPFDAEGRSATIRSRSSRARSPASSGWSVRAGPRPPRSSPGSSSATSSTAAKSS